MFWVVFSLPPSQTDPFSNHYFASLSRTNKTNLTKNNNGTVWWENFTLVACIWWIIGAYRLPQLPPAKNQTTMKIIYQTNLTACFFKEKIMKFASTKYDTQILRVKNNYSGKWKIRTLFIYTIFCVSNTYQLSNLFGQIWRNVSSEYQWDQQRLLLDWGTRPSNLTRRRPSLNHYHATFQFFPSFPILSKKHNDRFFVKMSGRFKN